MIGSLFVKAFLNSPQHFDINRAARPSSHDFSLRRRRASDIAHAPLNAQILLRNELKDGVELL